MKRVRSEGIPRVEAPRQPEPAKKASAPRRSAELSGAAPAGATIKDALPRLGAPSRPRHPALAAKEPLLSLRPAFSPTVKTPAGEVELPAIAGVPVRGLVSRFEGVKSYLDTSAFLSVDARFGKLTHEQFEAVGAALGGKSHVVFDASRDYRLQDFLPPKIQALVDQDLEIPETKTLPHTKHIGEGFSEGHDKQIGLTMNCHAAAWEAMRAYQGDEGAAAVYYGEMISMDGLTHDEKSFTKIGELDAAHAKDLLGLDLKPGDLVQLHDTNEWVRMTMLLHSAVYVGGGLFFEKPNTEGAEKGDAARYIEQEETPFRLTTVDNLIKPVSAAVEGKFRVEVLRATQPLADPHEAFGSSLEKDFEKHAKKKGRELGSELVIELEQGMAGNVREEHATALERVPTAQRADGTTTLVP